MLDTIKKYANQRLYGISNCNDILCEVEEFIYEQRIYQNTDCNVDTSCFKSDKVEKDSGTIINCNIIVNSVDSCNITITEQ